MRSLKLKAAHPDFICEIKNAAIAHQKTMAQKKPSFIFKNNAKHQVTGHMNLPVFPCPVIVKKFIINRWKALIPHRLYSNPARKGYEVAFKVHNLGITIPYVYGYAVSRNLIKNSTSYIVMTWMLDWTRFDKILLETSHRKDIFLGHWERYFLFLRSAAEKGIHHRDMKPGNVLFKADSQTFCFIDLEDIRIYNTINISFIKKHFNSIRKWYLNARVNPQWISDIKDLYEKTVCSKCLSKNNNALSGKT